MLGAFEGCRAAPAAGASGKDEQAAAGERGTGTTWRFSKGLGLYGGYRGVYIGGNGKENGNYNLGFRVSPN